MQTIQPDDLKGIDVSAWQGRIDFSSLRQANVRIMYIKATQGTDYIDPYLRENYDGARTNGYAVGFYHYLTARDEAECHAEARYFLDALGGMQSDCRVAVDLGNKDRLDVETFSQLCRVFLEDVEQRSGLRGMIYASASTARHDLQNLSAYPLWVAEYGVTQPESNASWPMWTGFQYSNTGRLPGIDGYVDLDVFTNAVLLAQPAVHPKPVQPPVHTKKSRDIYYTIQAGDTLSRIAERFHTSVEAIAQLNQIHNPNRIYIGEVLKIHTDVPAKAGAFASQYIVRQGDTLSRIAERFHTTVHALVQANDLHDPNRIFPGQVLKIPATRADAPHSSPTKQLDGTYVVKAGDTLARIAEKFDTSAAKLAEMNGLTDPDRIYPGQVLRIYASPLSLETKRFTGSYVVQPADTIATIARRFDRTPNDILAQNDLPGGQLLCGHILAI